MQLKYTKQPHQTKAINSIVELFQGQVKQESCYDIFDGEAVCSNSLMLDRATILENLNTIQKQNGIEPSHLESLDFSIEMETGTGKTYVYIKTILELYAHYGWNKFIILVPSIAIREGVLSSLNSLHHHFKDKYSFPYDYFEYDSSRLGALKHFIRDDALEIMVMTIDSFKRANTVLNMSREGFVGTPKESLKKTNPILILDEPQNMEWDSTTEKAFIGYADSHFKFFTKLPRKFKIKTPFGNYNPDFAIIKHDQSEGAFVVETKGSEKEKALRGAEKWKIAYARRHFEEIGVKYRAKVMDCKNL